MVRRLHRRSRAAARFRRRSRRRRLPRCPRQARHRRTRRTRLRRATWTQTSSSALSSLAGSRRSHSTRCYPEKRRSQAVHEWAAAHGWSFAKSDDSILRQWTPLPIRQGIARDVLRRTTDQGEVISLEQYYGSQTGSGTTWSWPCTGYSELNASRKFCHSYMIWPEKSIPVTGVASHELAHGGQGPPRKTLKKPYPLAVRRQTSSQGVGSKPSCLLDRLSSMTYGRVH